SELDILKQHHKFLQSEEDEAAAAVSWQARIASKYYAKLFKEYCLAEMSRFKEGKIAMRWRSQREVVAGKGQFECGNLNCSSTADLKSWEVNFAYAEAGERKNALVKLRLCPDCSRKLNYRKIKEKERMEKEQRKLAKAERKRRRKSEKKDRAAGSRPKESSNLDDSVSNSDGSEDSEDHHAKEQDRSRRDAKRSRHNASPQQQ
ncbi:folate-sensitive fragile site protein Fra10Ac1-domain-containing protein, partial [Entophlyctis helioformis]